MSNDCLAILHCIVSILSIKQLYIPTFQTLDSSNHDAIPSFYLVYNRMIEYSMCQFLKEYAGQENCQNFY